jgi:iron complex outermembrane receptor protein
MYRVLSIFLYLCIFVLIPLSALADENPIRQESPNKHFPIHLDEIVVSTPLQKSISNSAKPVTVIHDEELRLKSSGTIGETLKQELGVHGQSFGPGVGLPVIRGQSGPRVRVLSNGLGVNDASQASPDHASGSTPLLADRIEVLRGPATLLYGSGAIGGVVNVIDNRIPMYLPDELFSGGAFEQKFNSVSDEFSTTLKLEGGIGNFAYHLDGFYRENNNLDIGGASIDVPRALVSQPGLDVTQNPFGTLLNSHSFSRSGTAGVSYVGERGYFGVSANSLENEYGVPPDGTADGELVRILLEQSKFDFKSELKNPLGFLETVRTHLSYTDYQHAEGDEALFQNNTFEGRLEAPHKPFAGLNGVLGLQVITSKFSALEIEDNEFLVPVTRSTTYSIFATEEFSIADTTTEFGIRIEHATHDPRSAMHPSRSFTPVSASVSELWNINDNNSISLAFTHSERAPQVQELYFEGFHEATRAFERGNPNLGLEKSNNLDLGYKLISDLVTVQVDLFHNWINDYIFVQRTGNFVDGEPETINNQENARFWGYEANLIFTLIEHEYGDVDLTLFSDYTRATLSNGDNVPQIPPLRWGFQIDHALGNWNSNLRLTRAQDQNHFGPNEANTLGYWLLNISTHYHVEDFEGADLLFYAKGNNLLNQNIRNAASFLRNFSPEPGVGGEVGVRVNF